MILRDKLLKRKARVGVIGMGYVGLPEAVAMALAGFRVTGIDVNEDKVKKINRGVSYIPDVEKQDMAEVVRKKMLHATADPGVIRNLDVICICVPTPFNVYKEPDLSYVVSAINMVKDNFRKGQLVILESTTYPGTTREELLPVLGKGGFKAGKDFYLAFSPERVDPGNKEYSITNTPKLVGGITAACTELSRIFYSQFITRVIAVSSPEIAEMSKLLENIFRNVNIALVNELMLLCDRMKIDVWEVVEAAKTKPFGFMSFKPGPGVGGHCIPVDPVYLSWKAREYDFGTRFIELAAETNSNMPYYVVSKILNLLRGKKSGQGKVLMLGAAFKEDIGDSRNSPALKLIELMEKEDVNVFYNDPHVSVLKINGKIFKSRRLTPQLCREMDCVVILTDHSDYDYEWIARNSKLILDTRNATKNLKKYRKKIRKI